MTFKAKTILLSWLRNASMECAGIMGNVQQSKRQAKHLTVGML